MEHEQLVYLALIAFGLPPVLAESAVMRSFYLAWLVPAAVIFLRYTRREIEHEAEDKIKGGSSG